MLRRTWIAITIGILAIYVTSGVAKFPFNNSVKGGIGSNVRSIGWVHVTPPPEPYASAYRSRWGYYPDAVLWQDVGITAMKFSIGLGVRPDPYKTFPGWDPEPTWDDIEPHMVILVQDAVSGTVDTLSVSNIQCETYLTFPKTGYVDGKKAAYGAGIDSANAVELPLPLMNRIYRIWGEIWEIPDEPASKIARIRSDSTYLIKSNIETSMDSLMWSKSMYDNFTPDQLLFIKDVAHKWPYDARLQRKLYYYYYFEVPDCDSLKHYADRFLKAAEVDHSLGVTVGSPPLEESVQESIDEICGE
ncbi:hypothetical protein KQI52_15755 [bacterium]|nr:hypothetical protein [bacterium]